MVKDAYFDYVRAGLQLVADLCGRNLLPVAIRRKAYGDAVDVHVGASHCANAQTRCRRSIRQSKLAAECCVETGKPMYVCINCSRKNYPLCPSIAAQKIDCRIIPRDPYQNRHREGSKCDYPNRRMPRL